MSLLTFDLGNSGGSAAIVGSDGVAERLSGWTYTTPEHERTRIDACVLAARERLRGARLHAAVSAVGAPEREAGAVDALAQRELRALSNPNSGLALRIDRPETCGFDRQFAMRAALAAIEGDAARAIVVDAGTALTVDAGVRDGANGAFLGGAIALGPGALRDALVRAGARLPKFELATDVPALGRSSIEALRSGVVVGFRGTVAQLVAEVAAEAFTDAPIPRVFLTGGARAFARRPLQQALVLGQVHGPLHEDELLVHRGLALAAASAT